MDSLRVLFDPPAAGAWNMAVDETLLDTAADSGQATLRFYAWSAPTLSLGYFQPLADRARHAASSACPVVRRASGGGAILHDHELTYSIAIPQAAGQMSGGSELYEQCHQTLIRALADFGVSAALFQNSGKCNSETTQPTHQPFLCFQRRTCFDIVIDGTKVVGSAQRRRRGAVMQHGSILIARSAHAPELAGLREASAVSVEPAELAASWTPRLAAVSGMASCPGSLSGAEQARAEMLALKRFGSNEHLAKR